MPKYQKVFIYFDTNSLECRHSGKSLYLSKFTVNGIYYDIEKLVRDYNLRDITEICIPEVVWLEVKEHLISKFGSEKQAMESKIDAYKKSFGDLLDINYKFDTCRNTEEYKRYLEIITNEFLDNPRVTAKIISCPKDEETFENIIDQAIRSNKPFRTGKISGKEYTDAGFKDALIFNTLLKHTDNELGILVSNDNDFSDLFKEKSMQNLHLCKSLEEVKDILSKGFYILNIDIMKSLLKEDHYLLDRIIEESNLDKSFTYTFDEINECITSEDGLVVKFTMWVNGDRYSFEILYNIEANELLEASCELFEEAEV